MRSPSNTVIALSGVRAAWWASTANQFMSAAVGDAGVTRMTSRSHCVREEATGRVGGPLTSLAMATRAEPTGDSRRKANWEARREAIIDTSASVFARRGYHATGITELCAANDLGKGALYHYIGSKEELLAAIHDRVMDEVMLGADRVAAAGGIAVGAAGHAR